MEKVQCDYRTISCTGAYFNTYMRAATEFGQVFILFYFFFIWSQRLIYGLKLMVENTFVPFLEMYFWGASPPPSSTWQIGIFPPLPLKRAKLAGGSELMDGRQPGTQVMLLLLIFPSLPAYRRLFSWFLPSDRSAMPSKCFLLSVPVHSYRSNLTQGYLIWALFIYLFIFFSVAAPPPLAPCHWPIILLLNSLPPLPSQYTNTPHPPPTSAQFADSFPFLRGGLRSCWCLWFRRMAQLPHS